MFGPSTWGRDPSRRFHLNHRIGYHSPAPNYTDAFKPPSGRAHRYGQHRRPSPFAIEGSEFTDDTDREERYHVADERTLDDRLRSPRLHYSPHYPGPEPSISSAFQQLPVKLPARAIEKLGLRTDDMLILPQTLTRLRVTVRTHHGGSETLRAAVAGDMRLCDVVKQLLPASELRLLDVCIYVKVRGRWRESRPNGMVSEFVEQGRFGRDEKREMEMKIVVGDGAVGMGMGADVDVDSFMLSYERARAFWAA